MDAAASATFAFIIAAISSIETEVHAKFNLIPPISIAIQLNEIIDQLKNHFQLC